MRTIILSWYYRKTLWNSTCPLAKPQSRREQSWLMLRAETAPKSAPVALVPRQSRRAWLVSEHGKEQELLVTVQNRDSFLLLKKSNFQTNKRSPIEQIKKIKKISNTTHWQMKHWKCTGAAGRMDPSIEIRQQSMKENKQSGRQT